MLAVVKYVYIIGPTTYVVWGSIIHGGGPSRFGAEPCPVVDCCKMLDNVTSSVDVIPPFVVTERPLLVVSGDFVCAGLDVGFGGGAGGAGTSEKDSFRVAPPTWSIMIAI